MTPATPEILDRYKREAVFSGLKGSHWSPSDTSSSKRPDYIVDASPGRAPNQFRSLQAAINQAILDSDYSKNGARRRIEIRPGFYQGPVIISRDAPPLDIIGPGFEKAVITAPIDAQMPGREYKERFNSEFLGAPLSVRSAFESIAARQHISTGNTAVLRICRDDVSVSGLTIRNDYACDRILAAPHGAEPDIEGRFSHGQHQAVALHVDRADRIALWQLRLESFQDTLYLQAGANDADYRTYLSACQISGDVDFIFGGATAFFERCEIVSRGERAALSWATAPSTSIWRPFGFVFNDCRFRHDGTDFGADAGCFLGRQWFEGVRATPYGSPTLAGYNARLGERNELSGSHGHITTRTLEAVGKCILINADIGRHVDPHTPWDAWGGRTWSPRFRPIQATSRDFLHTLEGWLRANNLDYSALGPNETWLGIYQHA